MAYLQQAAFFDEVTVSGSCRVIAHEVEDGSWMLMDDQPRTTFQRPAVLATLRGPIGARRFATLDAAYRLCRKSVPVDSGIHLDFRVSGG